MMDRAAGVVCTLVGLFMGFVSLVSRPVEVGDVLAGMVAVVTVELGVAILVASLLHSDP